ncbi:homocysteine-induced endoplasmic reticulum protein [Cotesia typhae]|uniref:homocysteine-induced endoplasmic reticulum protein n=1 Tax=Cotesia typhae TaxID=2053667 RepID=UPI003D682889
MAKVNNDTVIRLLIRAPDQQIDDQTFNCQCDWTVGQLKEYLHEVYPNNPKKEDQKVIYSGQILNDSMILKDVFYQNYNLEEELFIVHLVCPSKISFASTSSSKNSTNKSASDKQNSNASVNNSPPSTTTTSPISSPLSSSGIQFAPPGIPMSPIQQYYTQLNTQQLAWMQQAYAQYLNQYMQLIASQGIQFQSVPYVQPSNLNANPLNTRDSVNLPSTSSTVLPGIPSTSGTSAAASNQDQTRIQRNDNENRQMNNNNNNINNNNNNNNNNNAGEDNEAALNRDWLDVFDVFARVIVLSSIVYFYSSPSRFLLVTMLGFAIYLIQGGFFRGQQVDLTDNNGRAENNNNNINVNNNNNVNANNNNNNVINGNRVNQENIINNPANEPLIGLQDQQPQLRRRLNVQHSIINSTAATNSNINTNVNETNNEETRTVNQNEDNERPGALALTWTFFSSFFASLIPEQPHVL